MSNQYPNQWNQQQMPPQQQWHYQYPPQQMPYPQQPHYAQMKVRKKSSHTFHLIMTLITCGCWAPVWIGVAMWNAMGPKSKQQIRYY